MMRWAGDLTCLTTHTVEGTLTDHDTQDSRHSHDKLHDILLLMETNDCLKYVLFLLRLFIYSPRDDSPLTGLSVFVTCVFRLFSVYLCACVTGLSVSRQRYGSTAAPPVEVF